MPDQTENASERQNAGQETATDAEWVARPTAKGIAHHLDVVYARVRVMDEQRRVAEARAYAAEAQLAELRAEVERLNLEIQGYQTNNGYEKGWEHGTASGRAWKRERDEALSTLDAIQDHAAGFHAFMIGPGRCNPDEVRTRAVSALDGIRRVFEGVTDREPTTVDRVRSELEMLALRERDQVQRQRDELAEKVGGFETYLSRLNAELDEWAERDERFHPLIESVRAITVPVTDREEPAQDWDDDGEEVTFFEVDHAALNERNPVEPRPSEDPAPVRECGHSGPCDCPPEGIHEASEEPARCRCGARPGAEHLRNCPERCQDCGGDPAGPRRCRCTESSEEPAGETKPPRGDGGKYIREHYGVPAEIGRKILFQGKPGEIVGFEPGGAHMYAIGEYGYDEPVMLHPTWEVEYLDDTGRPVERQADRETQR